MKVAFAQGKEAHRNAFRSGYSYLRHYSGILVAYRHIKVVILKLIAFILRPTG